LKSGDVIVEFNGKKVEDPSALARAVAVVKPGETSKLRIWRDRQQQTVEVKLGELPGERAAAAAGPAGKSGLGLTVQPVTPDVARQLDLKDPSGVVVTRVEPSGPAAEAGLQRGDVIVEVDRKPVKSVDDFEKLTTQSGGKQVLMRVQREGTAMYVALAPSTN
jgi:serine protease Do